MKEAIPPIHKERPTNDVTGQVTLIGYLADGTPSDESLTYYPDLDDIEPTWTFQEDIDINELIKIGLPSKEDVDFLLNCQRREVKKFFKNRPTRSTGVQHPYVEVATQTDNDYGRRTTPYPELMKCLFGSRGDQDIHHGAGQRNLRTSSCQKSATSSRQDPQTLTAIPPVPSRETRNPKKPAIESLGSSSEPIVEPSSSLVTPENPNNPCNDDPYRYSEETSEPTCSFQMYRKNKKLFDETKASSSKSTAEPLPKTPPKPDP